MIARHLLLLTVLLAGCPAAHKYKQGDLVAIKGSNEPLAVEEALVFHDSIVVVNRLGQRSTIKEAILVPYEPITK